MMFPCQSAGRFPAICLVSLWSIAGLGGLLALSIHENAPGDVGHIDERWIADMPIERGCDRSTLLLFAHPQCPCVRASLLNLGDLLRVCGDRVRAYVVVYQPETSSPGWSIARDRLPIPELENSRSVGDPGGRIAQRCGARTSGDCMLYDENGRLIYRGGITASRGHQGESVERAILARLITSDTRSSLTVMPVFGCPLFETPSPGGL